MKFVLFGLIGAACAIACNEETNPYRDRYVKQKLQSSLESEQTASDGGDASASQGVVNEEDGIASEAAADVGQVSVTKTSEEDTKKVAEPEAIPKVSLSAAQQVCQSGAIFAALKVEADVLCLNGQPTAAFANLLVNPYSGAGKPQVAKIRSVDNNGTSDFIFATSAAIPSPIANVVAKRGNIANLNFVEGNATFVSNFVADLPPSGGASLGGVETKETFTIKVAIVSVTDVRVMQTKYIGLNPEATVLAGITQLKPGAPDNAENILGNILTLILADGANTKIVAVAHQMIANRGQHATAESTGLAVTSRVMAETFLKLK